MTTKKSPGEAHVFSVSCQTGLIDDVDKIIIDFIRNETGMKLTRSKLLQVLMLLALDAVDHLDPSNAYDEATLQEAFKAAIKKMD